MTRAELKAFAAAKIAEAEALFKEAAVEQAAADAPDATPTATAPLKSRVDPGEGTPSVADINQAAVAAQEAKL